MKEKSNEEHLIITEEQSNIRIDKLLADTFPSFSRTYFQYLLENGAVLVNGNPVKKREKLHVADEIEVCFLLTPEISLEPQDIPLEIIYEDEWLIAVNKPAGMVTHPAPGNPKDTFVNALLFHCKNLQTTSDLRPGIVHRLDKDTSGILIAAKTTEAHQKMVSLFSSRQIEKRYLTICVGNPGNVTIEENIGRHPIRRQEMTVCDRMIGREAISICRTLSAKDGFSYVEVQILTGRTHQIRVHLKSRNTPVLGDEIYGIDSMNKKMGVFRQKLHARRLSFIHPFTREKLTLEAAIPADMQELIKKLF